LCDYLIDVRLDIDDYWDNIKPLVDKAYSNGFISKNTIQKQKDFIVKEYESRIKRSGYGKRKKIIENLRIIKPSHKMIKRFKKEEEFFDILKKSRLEEIEEEKERRIAEVKSDIEKQVEKRKEKAKKDHNIDGARSVGVGIGVVIGIIASIGSGVAGFIILVILFPIAGNFIAIEIDRNIAASKVTITPEEEKDRDERIENIEEDIQNKIAHLDNEIRKEIFKKTDEKIDEIFGNME
jgi:uncharacterized protein YcfJ